MLIESIVISLINFIILTFVDLLIANHHFISGLECFLLVNSLVDFTSFFYLYSLDIAMGSILIFYVMFLVFLIESEYPQKMYSTFYNTLVTFDFI